MKPMGSRQARRDGGGAPITGCGCAARLSLRLVLTVALVVWLLPLAAQPAVSTPEADEMGGPVSAPHTLADTSSAEQDPTTPQGVYREVVLVAKNYRDGAGPWFCSPDLGTAFTEEEEEADSDSEKERAGAAARSRRSLHTRDRAPDRAAHDEVTNRRLLSRLGVPFIFDPTDPDDVLCFGRLLAFRVPTRGGGVCPVHSESSYVFHPLALEERYGPERLVEWDRAAVPWQWTVVEPDSGYAGNLLHTADAYVAGLPSPPRVPGWVRLRLPPSWSHTGTEMDLSLADMHVGTDPTQASMPVIHFDGEAAVERLHRQLRVRAKLAYSKGIDSHDRAIRREARRVARSVAEELARAQARYTAERGRREQYDAFVSARRERRVSESTSDTSATATSPSSGRGSRAVPGSRTAAQVAVEAERKAHRGAVACAKLSRALATLAGSPPQDTRVVGLRALLAQRGCAAAGAEQGAEERRRVPAAEEACSRYCGAVSELVQWGQRTGARQTVAQHLGLLLSLHTGDEGIRADPDASDEDAGALPGAAVDEGVDGEGDSAAAAQRFAARVSRWVQQGFFAGCPCEQPVAVRAEMHYTTALLDLLQLSRSPTATARGVAGLYQAMWLGSTQAAAALSTLRESGMYTPQNPRAAMALLAASLADRPSSFYRQLWRELRSRVGGATGGAVGEAAAERPPAVPASPGVAVRAERLLRSESMYATGNNFQNVDAPFLTREFVEGFFAVADQYVQSAGDDGEDDTSGTSRHVAESVLLEEERQMESEQGRYTRVSRVGPVAARAKNLMIMASVHLMGYKVTRNVDAAECELLRVLRSFDYLCDIQLLMRLAYDRSEEAAEGDKERRERVTRVVMAEQRAVCAAHDAALTMTLRHPHTHRFRCPWRGSTEGGERTGPPFPLIEENFNTLHGTLTTLGYVYLVRGDYARAALYARLSIKLSASVLQEVYRMPVTMLMFALPQYLRVRRVHGRAEALRRVRTYPNGFQLARWWAHRVVLDMADVDEEWLVTALMKGVTRRGVRESVNVTWPPFALVDTSLPVFEGLVILAMSVLLDNTPHGRRDAQVRAADNRSGGGAGVGSREETVALWSAHAVLRDAFGVPSTALAELATLPGSIFARGGERAGGLAKHDGPAPRALSRRQLQQQTALFLLTAATSQWRAVGEAGHVLVNTRHSLHTVDPFLMISWLLADMSAAPEEGGGGVSVDAIRHAAATLGVRLTGTRPYLPFFHDSIESYTRRLLLYVTRHVRTSSGFVEALHQGRARSRGGAVVAGPDRAEGRVLGMVRMVKQLWTDPANFQPLLFASDTHAYVTRRAGWTVLERLGDALRNGAYYLFTETDAETLARKFGLEVLSPAARHQRPSRDGGRDGESAVSTSEGGGTAARRPESPAAFVQDYQELFRTRVHVRELTIATLLFSAALESGAAEGFRLLFLEAAERRNALLLPVVDYLAQDVLGPVAAGFWNEAHVVAQWHLDKPRTFRGMSGFGLDSHLPFSASHWEPRLELMAAADRWRATRLIEAYKRSSPRGAGNGGGEAVLAPRPARAALRAATDILARCAGTLVHAALERYCDGGGGGEANGTRAAPRTLAEELPRAPLEGMRLPAARPECVQDLVKLLQLRARAAASLRDECGSDGRTFAFTNTDARALVDGLLADMLIRIALYYNLTEEAAPRRVLPSTQEVFGEGVGRSGGATNRAASLDGRGSDEGGDGYPDDDGDDDDEKGRRWFSVEPWNRAHKGDDDPILLPAAGEGSYYYGRLHRVTGMRNGARLQSALLWLKDKRSSLGRYVSRWL